METQYLKTLLVAVEEGSFSRAAVKLNLTQSAVSQRTKGLESCCGVQLLDRSGATLQPTVAGQVVIDMAKRILQTEEQMLRSLRDLQEKKHLHICCTPAFGVAHLPHIIRAFTSKNDDIDDLVFMFASPAQALDGLRAGEFDIAIIEHLPKLDLGSLMHLALPQDEMVFVSAPQLNLTAGDIELADLQQHCFILRRAGCSCRDLLTLNLDAVNSDVDQFKRMMVLDDFGIIVDEVVAGLGVTFISRSVVADYLEDGRLREHSVAGFERTRQRSIVALSCEMPTSLKRLFMESVMEYFNNNAIAGSI